MADDLTLTVGGRKMSGWTSIRVTRGIERCPSDFEITMTELYPNEVSAFIIQPGDSCTVKLGDDLVITGYVDRFSPSFSAGQHAIRVMGRSKCADLVDCAAEWPNGQISGSNVLEIARKLAEPYGKFSDGRQAIPLTVGSNVTDLGPIIKQFNLILGETPFAIIERLCRYAALLVYDLPDGNLFLTRVATVAAASGFQEGINVQSASMDYCSDQMYSVYEAFIQNLDTFSDAGDDGNLLAIVEDPNMARHRKMVIIAENGDSEFVVTKKRALWESNRRFGRSLRLHVTTDGWRDSSGALYAPNTLVPLSLRSLKLVDATWLISEVTYNRDGQNGTTCDLVIMPPEAFDIQPILLYKVLADIPAAAGK